MSPKKIPDQTYLLQRLEFLKEFGITIDNEQIIQKSENVEMNRYKALKRILEGVIDSNRGHVELLYSCYNALFVAAYKHKIKNWYQLHKSAIFYHAQIRVKQIIEANNSTKDYKFSILIHSSTCGNCEHMKDKYIELDTTFEDFPIPVLNCKRPICSAICTVRQTKYLDRLGLSKL